MKPLQSIAMGLVIVALVARVGDGYDVLPDPLGWVLVLRGVAALPATLPRRAALRVLGALALLMSVVLWFPALSGALAETDESLLWAANLPQLGFVALLCLDLARAARIAPDLSRARWLHTAGVLTVVVALLPVVVLGAADGALAAEMALAASLVLLLVIVLLFRYATRPWALPAATAEVDQTAST